VYKVSGIVCISILHPPVEDEMSGESPEERWLPTQTATTILLSVISLLNAPNFSSPANVDASVEWRKNPDTYKDRCKKLIEKANKEKPSYVIIPHPDTNPEEKAKQVEKIKKQEHPIEIDDFMMHDDVNEDEDEEDPVEDNESQSSKEESSPKSKKKIKKATKTVTKSKKDQSIKTSTRKKKKCNLM